MRHKIKIAPSMLSSDFANLHTEIEKCNTAGVDIIHIDVMDGHFVPNITIGPLIVAAIRPYTSILLDCHLMIENPEKYIPAFIESGADMISVHCEGVTHLHRTISLIKDIKNEVKSGIALNPLTPISYALEAAEYVDFILLMSVNPGFSGQQFISSFHYKCNKLRNYLDNNGLKNVEIEVDGGVKADNLCEVIDSGANILVSGSGLFGSDFYNNVNIFKQIISSRQTN